MNQINQFGIGQAFSEGLMRGASMNDEAMKKAAYNIENAKGNVASELPLSPMKESIEAIKGRLEYLENCIGGLATRLRPVIGQPSQNNQVSGSIFRGSSQTVIDLNEIIQRIDYLVDSVCVLRDAVEV